MIEKTTYEIADEKGYFGEEASAAAQAEESEAAQTEGGPVLVDSDRDPISGERQDTDAAGNPVNADARTSRTDGPPPADTKDAKAPQKSSHKS